MAKIKLINGAINVELLDESFVQTWFIHQFRLYEFLKVNDNAEVFRSEMVNFFVFKNYNKIFGEPILEALDSFVALLKNKTLDLVVKNNMSVKEYLEYCEEFQISLDSFFDKLNIKELSEFFYGMFEGFPIIGFLNSLRNLSTIQNNNLFVIPNNDSPA